MGRAVIKVTGRPVGRVKAVAPVPARRPDNAISYGGPGYAVRVPQYLPDGRRNPLYIGRGGYGSVPTAPGVNRPGWATSTTPSSAVTYNPGALADASARPPVSGQAPSNTANPWAKVTTPWDAGAQRVIDGIYADNWARHVRNQGQREDLQAEYFNPADPFSRAALLNRNWAESSRRNQQQMIASGIGFSGAAQQQAALDRRGRSQAMDALTKAYTDRLRSINEGEVEGDRLARQSVDNTLWQALLARLARGAAGDVNATGEKSRTPAKTAPAKTAPSKGKKK